MNDLLDPPRPTLSRPDSDDLESLMSARGLCISILINTTPGPAWLNPTGSACTRMPATCCAGSRWNRMQNTRS